MTAFCIPSKATDNGRSSDWRPDTRRTALREMPAQIKELFTFCGNRCGGRSRYRRFLPLLRRTTLTKRSLEDLSFFCFFISSSHMILLISKVTKSPDTSNYCPVAELRYWRS